MGTRCRLFGVRHRSWPSAAQCLGPNRPETALSHATGVDELIHQLRLGRLVQRQEDETAPLVHDDPSRASGITSARSM